ncbi:MAG: DNA polymerase IV, partial [Thermoplasmatota archaeon]
MGRVVFHVDMDAFYAAVEARERPEWATVPLIIGGDPKGGEGRGVVSTANYEARKYGIRSAMAISAAYNACPNGVFIRPDFQKYKPASQEVMAILAEYADVLQVVGMDEAYLDVSERTGGCYRKARNLALSLQAAIRRRTQLSCSIGVGPSKSVAKIG